jgi:hypothetical protein
MVFYNCEKCGKEFNRKSNYLYHIENVSNCDKIKDKQIYKCYYCETSFTLKNNLTRHNKICKEKNKQEDEMISIKINDFNKMLEIINTNKINVEINNESKTQNINPFGKEENILIPDEIYFESINNLTKGIPLLIKYVHYNIKYPQNKNIKGRGLSSKYIEVHDGEDWIVDNKKNVINKLITDKKILLENFVNDQIEKNSISESILNLYKKQLEKLENISNNDFEELEEEVNITIENEKNKAKRKKKVLD